jgi:hypothetical protein
MNSLWSCVPASHISNTNHSPTESCGQFSLKRISFLSDDYIHHNENTDSAHEVQRGALVPWQQSYICPTDNNHSVYDIYTRYGFELRNA